MSSHGIKLARFISALILVEKLQLSHRTACSDLTEGAEIVKIGRIRSIYIIPFVLPFLSLSKTVKNLKILKMNSPNRLRRAQQSCCVYSV